MADVIQTQAPAPPDATQAAPPPVVVGTDALAQPGVNAAPSPAPPALTAAPEASAGTPVKNVGGHTKLLALVQGLADGLSAAGSSVSSGGREGGAGMVQSLEAQRQQQTIAAQKAQQDAANADLQHKLMTGQINESNTRNWMNLQTAPDEIQASHLKVAGAVQAQAGEAQTQAITGANYQQAHGGATPEEYSAEISNTQPGSAQGSSAAGTFIKTQAAQQLGAIGKVLGPDDPYVQKLQTILNDPKATSHDLLLATTHLQTQQVYQEAATDALTKKEAAGVNAPFGPKADNLNAAMTERYQVLNPGKPLPDNLKMTADSSPKDFDRVDKILQQTETAQATKANRDIVNGMRQQTLALSGLGAPGGNTKLSGDAYLQSLATPEQAVVREFGTGHMVPTRIDMLLSRNPKLMAEVALAYPDIDTSKLEAYPTLYKDFTSGKTAVALNAGGTALGHLAELKALNTPASHIPHTPSWTAYQNKANTVSAELAKFYGTDNIPGVESIRSSLASTLPGNRDTAIQTQAQSMGDKLDAFDQQWKNGAPSKAYEAAMPSLSDKAKAARAELDSNYTTSPQTQVAMTPSAAAPPKAADYPRPANIPATAKLMVAPGGSPHWLTTPAQIAAAQKLGATEVQ
jgi:hypothetical protein